MLGIKNIQKSLEGVQMLKKLPKKQKNKDQKTRTIGQNGLEQLAKMN